LTRIANVDYVTVYSHIIRERIRLNFDHFPQQWRCIGLKYSDGKQRFTVEFEAGGTVFKKIDTSEPDAIIVSLALAIKRNARLFPGTVTATFILARARGRMYSRLRRLGGVGRMDGPVPNEDRTRNRRYDDDTDDE